MVWQSPKGGPWGGRRGGSGMDTQGLLSWLVAALLMRYDLGCHQEKMRLRSPTPVPKQTCPRQTAPLCGKPRLAFVCHGRKLGIRILRDSPAIRHRDLQWRERVGPFATLQYTALATYQKRHPTRKSTYSHWLTHTPTLSACTSACPCNRITCSRHEQAT